MMVSNKQEKLEQLFEEMPEINVGNYRIIPLYHPTAQIKKEGQLAQYERIWKS